MMMLMLISARFSFILIVFEFSSRFFSLPFLFVCVPMCVSRVCLIGYMHSCQVEQRILARGDNVSAEDHIADSVFAQVQYLIKLSAFNLFIFPGQ